MEVEKDEARPSRPTLHAAISGTAGPAVVLLHGFGGGGAVWEDIARRLASNHIAIAYDLPGHGLSVDYPGYGPPKTAARAVIDDIRSRGLAAVHLVGHSMGGAIATLAAYGAPDLIASLTLIAPGGMGEEINAPLLRRFGAAHEANQIAACLREMSGPDAGDIAAAATALARIRLANEQRRALVAISELITKDGRQGAFPPEMLASLSMPVTVLWGDGDAVLPFHQTRNLPPRFDIRALPGAGHMLVEETPDAIIDAILGRTATAAGNRAD